MKYKVGDKFLQEIKIIAIERIGAQTYIVTEACQRAYDESDFDKLRRPKDMTAEAISMEAWETARKICNMDGDTRMNILGEKYYHMAEVYEDFTPQQAKAQIEAWKAEQEIKVGDVVKTKNPIKAVVLDIHDEYFDVLVENGCAEEWYKSKVTKTGRHIDIQSVLEQIGGEE